MSRSYFRLSLSHRLLHGLLILTFLGLVGTGMPLRYSQAAWAVRLSHTLGGFSVMGFFHRLFAVLLTLCFLLHLAQIVYHAWIRREWKVLWGPDSLVPQPKDFVDFYHHARWFLGRGPRPAFDRFTYWEKFDYWAVFWGMAIIGTSGYVLWFHGFFSRFFPGWIFNVALLIHGEEALLAAGFIFAIHFFNTHLRPEKFPMDPVIFTGRISEPELRQERTAEYERLCRQGTLEALQTTAAPLWMRNLSWILGGVSVAIGLLLFLLILFAVFTAANAANNS